MCWRGKKETRLRKSEKSVGEVLKSLKQKAQKCTISKFLIQIRKCFKTHSIKAVGTRELTGRDPCMSSPEILLEYSKYCTSAACVYACVCARQRE